MQEDIFTKVVTTVPSENKTSAVNIIPDMSIDAAAMASKINNEVVNKSIPSKNCETSIIKKFIYIPSISTDATAICSNIKSKIIKKSIDSDVNDLLPMNTSDDQKLNNIVSNNVESLSFGTNASYKISLNDTPEEIVLKERIISMRRLLTEKSTLIKYLQKKNCKQQKRIFKLKSIVSELKNFTSKDNDYTNE